MSTSKMSTSNKRLQSIGIGILAVTIAGSIVRALFTGLDHAPWAFITVSAALLGTLLTVRDNLRIQDRSAQAPMKAEIYDKLIKYIFDATIPTPGREPVSKESLAGIQADITPELILWGSDDVLKLFMEFRQAGFIQTECPEKKASEGLILLLGQILVAIRKDLGYENQKISELSILRTFISDSTLSAYRQMLVTKDQKSP